MWRKPIPPGPVPEPENNWLKWAIIGGIGFLLLIIIIILAVVLGKKEEHKQQNEGLQTTG